MWWALWWILTVLSALYTARRLWLSRPKELSLKDRADAINSFTMIQDKNVRAWLMWHWGLATDEHGPDYVFQAMPALIRRKGPELAPRRVDPVPSSWRTDERTLTEGALWADRRNLTEDLVRLHGVPLAHLRAQQLERIKSETKSSGGSSRPPDRWSDLVYRSSSPHR